MAAFTRATDGLITAVSWTPAGHGAVNLATSIAYEPFGPLASLTFGNGLSLTQTWDADYRLADSKLASGSGSVLDLAPAWQADGRIASLTDNAATGRAAAFSYTPSGRVWTAGGPWGTGTSAYAYSYDAAGNQTQAGPSGAPITAIVNPTNNQVSSTSSGGATQRSLTYTAGGLLTGDTWAGGTNWTFTYNAARRLIQVKASGASSGQYGYDFKGQRVWRLVNAGGGSQAAYVHDEAGHLLAEHSMNTGAMSREYVWLDDTPIATVYLASGVPTIAYIHTGQIGEPLAMTSASQALLWNGYVDPFGTAGTFSTPTVSLDMRLPGQSAQAEADGFSQNHWRDYDPTLGRYTEPDPLGIDAGQNVYPYVDGDGLNWTDRAGLKNFTLFRELFPGSGVYHRSTFITDCMCHIIKYYGYGPSTGSLRHPGFLVEENGGSLETENDDRQAFKDACWLGFAFRLRGAAILIPGADSDADVERRGNLLDNILGNVVQPGRQPYNALGINSNTANQFVSPLPFIPLWAPGSELTSKLPLSH